MIFNTFQYICSITLEMWFHSAAYAKQQDSNWETRNFEILCFPPTFQKTLVSFMNNLQYILKVYVLLISWWPRFQCKETYNQEVMYLVLQCHGLWGWELSNLNNLGSHITIMLCTSTLIMLKDYCTSMISSDYWSDYWFMKNIKCSRTPWEKCEQVVNDILKCGESHFCSQPGPKGKILDYITIYLPMLSKLGDGFSPTLIAASRSGIATNSSMD